jgi:hypothetical protein
MFAPVEVEAEQPRPVAKEPDRAEAERGVELMEEISAGFRGCAILDGEEQALAASAEAGVWEEGARAFLAAADAARPGAPAAQVHVATEDGEVFAVRRGELAMVAVTDRFPLASLVLSDMRAILRDLASGEVVDRRAPGRGVAPDEVDPEAAVPPVD